MSGACDRESLSYHLVQLFKAHRAYAGALLGEVGLFPGQEFMLTLLADEQGLTPSQLADRCGVQAPTVSKTLQRMEAQGFVERRPHPQDSRVTQVFLTEKGEGLREAVDEIWNTLEARTVKGLTQEEQALLRRLLVRMHHNLTETG
jgi:DNA-binding MarR family transcriptional regulator